ncbi:homoserine dehydrogenase [Superficieibacter sp. 1612_C1]|uniref:homoserine dehydrogenase n=1 Tax=Superficieibacter sp. 1612_C1 TaxID=2780382 RepID=UPI0018837856|nr:homoserine dehydrogenase [Superficieibacter sp. 1612_C1]
MNYTLLFDTLNTRQIRIAITGASGGFGRSLLVQCREIPSIEIVALCDLNVEGSQSLLNDLNYCTDAEICEDAGQAIAAQQAGKTAIIRDYTLLDALDLDMVIEATGKPEISIAIAIHALQRGVHVGMVSKETDSVAGPWLNQLALKHDAVYTTVDGDQPSNLLGLITWAQVLGLEIVAAGKSSEYDFVWSPASNTITWCDRQVEVSGLTECWQLSDDIAATLARRTSLLSMLPLSATPDYCEMNVVANSAALTPACDEMSYPMCHISELADIFIPEEDGGILKRHGVVDVFNCLRREDEVSFGGGVFIIVRCKDNATWEMLAGKGHVVSKNGKYACIYLPYHIMGLESPLSIFSAVLHHRASGATNQQIHAVMAGYADRPLKKGELLEMGGHHHTIPNVSARLLPKSAGAGIAPYYLLSNKVLTRDIPQGELIPLDALHMEDSLLYTAWKETF